MWLLTIASIKRVGLITCILLASYPNFKVHIILILFRYAMELKSDKVLRMWPGFVRKPVNMMLWISFFGYEVNIRTD